MLKPLLNSSSSASSTAAVRRERLSAATSNVTWSSEGIAVQPVPDPRRTIRNLPSLAIPPRNPFHAPSANALRIKGTVSNTSRGIPPRPEAPAARAEHLSHALAHRVTSATHAVSAPTPVGNTPSEIAARSLLKEASDLRTIARSIRARAVDINNDDISALYAFISGLEALIRAWFVASETYLTDIFLNDRNRNERWTLRANLLEALLAIDLVRRPALARQGPHTADRMCSAAEKVANEIENCACIDARTCANMDQPQITAFRIVVDRCFKEAGAFVKEGLEQGIAKEIPNPNVSTKALKKSLAKRVFPNKKKWIERHSSWVHTFQRAELEYRQMYAA